MTNKNKEQGVCVLCDGEYNYYGNDPRPIMTVGRCCDQCNYNKVSSARLTARVA